MNFEARIGIQWGRMVVSISLCNTGVILGEFLFYRSHFHAHFLLAHNVFVEIPHRLLIAVLSTFALPFVTKTSYKLPTPHNLILVISYISNIICISCGVIVAGNYVSSGKIQSNGTPPRK